MLARFFDDITLNFSPWFSAGLARKIPRSVYDWKRAELFRYTVRYAYRHSKFYRKKFDLLGIDPRKVKTPSDLGDFFTTPEDVISGAEDFLCRRPQIVFESSGTTGKNKRIYYSYDEIDRIGKYNAAGLALGGVTHDDRIVNAFDFCIWIPGLISHKGLEKGCFFELAAGKIDPAEVYKRIGVYNITVLMGEPTWLIKLTEIAEKKGSYPLKFIIAGAEHMPEGARAWMEEVWKPARVRMVYGTVEAGGILGFEAFEECKAYHVDENNFYLEIADPDREGYGEIAYTTLGRTTMPLIRYKNRDISRLSDKICECGLPYRKLERLRGRSDEMVVASGGNLYPLMFEDVLKGVDCVTTDWQVVIKSRGMKEVMELNLEVRNGCADETLRERVFSRIKSCYPDLWKNYSLGTFEIEFVRHPAGSLRAGRKLLRLVDRRRVQY
ncbi:MAG: AMP-binding protein [Candidatus Omnitrophica bacterium]|nr:AMP-binding protein [Candidatus Omnitrophota bacterium]